MLPAQPITPFQSASLYVGDLHPDVTENSLFDMFNVVGPVASIRVCRDSMTRRSLGYAYVNFHNVQDAERALDTMNFTDINGKPCRIMWSQRDPSLRKTGMGNIFVRNLASTVDNKGLYDTFSVFGNILSCKVATDETGKSKGYGYVHFETAEAAQDAIQKFDGMIIEDSEVKVIPFVRKQDRSAPSVWTNIYLKQFPTAWDEAKLREVVAPFGEIQSIAISRDADGKSKGFGFVNLTSHEAASKAVAELNNKTIEFEGTSYTLYAGRAQKKSERVRELRAKQEMFNVERINKSQGKNLYVKNVADTVSDEMFKEAFAPYGKITSAKIMRDKNDNTTSRGFGFVCFETQEEATKAVNEMNNKNLAGKPLYVTYYEKKDQRRAHFAANYAPANMRGGGFGPAGPNGVPPMPFMGMYMPGQQGFNNPRGMPFAGRGGAGAPRPNFGRGGNYFPPMQQPYNMQGKPRGPGGNFPPMQPGFNGQPGMRRPPQGNAPMAGMPMPSQPRGNMPGQPRPMYGQPPAPGQFSQPPVMAPYGPRGATTLKFNAQARNQNGQAMPGMMPGDVPMPMPPQNPAKMDFSEALLNTTDPQLQKNMIGEKLYPLIHMHQPDQAGKITGMLLEMDNGELLNLIESPEALTAKINEALQVLRNHKPIA